MKEKPGKEKPDVLQGTLALMVLKTLDVLGPQHGYGTPNSPFEVSDATRVHAAFI